MAVQPGLQKPFEQIKQNLDKLGPLGPRYAPNNSFAKDPYGKEFIQTKNKAEAAIAQFPTAIVGPADKKQYNDALANVETQISAQYTRWAGGDFTEHKEVKDAFDALNTQITQLETKAGADPEVKKFVGEQKEYIQKLQTEKEVEAAKSLGQSLAHQYETNNSESMARKQGLNRSTMFRALDALDEEELKKQLRGDPPSIVALTNDDELMTLRMKSFLNKDHRLFQSELYPGLTIERTDQGCRLHTIPKDKDNYKGYKECYTAMMKFARTNDPNEVFIFSIEKKDPNSPILIRSAHDINKKILSAFEAAEAAGAQVELDFELRTHLLKLRADALNRSGLTKIFTGEIDLFRAALGKEYDMVKMIDTVFEKEQDLLRPGKKNEIIGKNAQEWAEKVEQKSTELDKLSPPKNEAYVKEVERLMTNPPGRTEEQAIEFLAQNVSPPGTADAKKVEDITNKLNALDARIQATRDTAILMELQVRELKSAAEHPNDPIFHNIPALSSDGHIKKLEELGAKNQSTLAEIALEAKVLQKALQNVTHGVPATPEAASAVAAVDEKINAIDGLSTRNGIASTQANTFKTARQTAEAEARAAARPT